MWPAIVEFTSTSSARFMHVETVIEQLGLDPNHEFFGSTLGSANFGPWLGLRLAKPHTQG